jgi:hypothetical protein
MNKELGVLHPGDTVELKDNFPIDYNVLRLASDPDSSFIEWEIYADSAEKRAGQFSIGELRRTPIHNVDF